MSETKTEVALVSLPTLPAELENAFLDEAFINGLIEEVRVKASSVVGDLNKGTGRGVYISMADKVRKTKTMIENAGKDLVAEMKAKPAKIDAGRKRYRDAFDALATEIRKPVTDWEEAQAQKKADEEAEEARKWQEAEAKREAEIAAQKKKSDHEVALLLNEKYDRDLADRLAAQERQRIENEERIRKEAAEKAIRDEQARHQAELDAAARREAEAKLAKEKAERDAREAAEKAAYDLAEAARWAEADRIKALEAAEMEKQKAIEKTRREERDRELIRLAEEKRIADEAAARAANVEHQKAVNNAAAKILVDAGISAEQAKTCLIAIIKQQNANAAAGINSVISVNY